MSKGVKGCKCYFEWVIEEVSRIGANDSSAATILSLLEEGSFDYGSVFTDQAPLPMDFESSI